MENIPHEKNNKKKQNESKIIHKQQAKEYAKGRGVFNIKEDEIRKQKW